MSFISGVKGFASQLKRSAVNLYRAVPRDRRTLAEIHKKKFGLIKEAGIRKVSRETVQTSFKLLEAGKDLATLVLPQIKKTEPGSFAFLVHPRDISDIYLPYPAFRYLPDSWVMEFSKYLPPITLSHMKGVTSLKDGRPLKGQLLSIVLTPQHMMEDLSFVATRAVYMAMLARKKGISFIGLGALLPFLTKYGELINEHVEGISITTGHAYTSSVIAQTALRVSEIVAPKKRTKIAVVGAAGSTGAASAWILAKSGVENLLLIEQLKKMGDLEKLKQKLVLNFPRMEIEASSDLGDISRAQIIVTVTNAPEAIVEEKWIRPGMIFVDDAQPPNVSEELAEKRPDIRVLKVLAHVPKLDPDFDFKLGTSPDITFTCLAETATLAAHEWGSNFTVGRVKDIVKVMSIDRLAREVGVRLPEDFYGYKGKKITADEIREVGRLWNARL